CVERRRRPGLRAGDVPVEAGTGAVAAATALGGATRHALRYTGLAPKGSMPRFIEGKLTAEGLRFAIVVSRWNSFITEELLAGALDALKRHGVDDGDVDVVRVAGSFEIGPAARTLLEKGAGRYDGLIALGAVIRGGTPHFDYIA